MLSLKECIAAFVNGILEPLAGLKRSGEEVELIHVHFSETWLIIFVVLQGGFPTCLIVVDGLCEAEYHRPDYGDTVGSFLVRHALHFPHWPKLIVTVRTGLQDITQLLPYACVSLDPSPSNDAAKKDITEYVTLRVNSTPVIRNNITLAGAKSGEGILAQVSRFSQHLSLPSKANFLHTKLTLVLIERRHLVTKSASFKVIVSFDETMLADCDINHRFQL